MIFNQTIKLKLYRSCVNFAVIKDFNHLHLIIVFNDLIYISLYESLLILPVHCAGPGQVTGDSLYPVRHQLVPILWPRSPTLVVGVVCGEQTVRLSHDLLPLQCTRGPLGVHRSF